MPHIAIEIDNTKLRRVRQSFLQSKAAERQKNVAPRREPWVREFPRPSRGAAKERLLMPATNLFE
jgi:hypothetical protein